MKNKVKLRMCGLLFEYDVRLSVKLYFAKSYMNIRTTAEQRSLCSVFLCMKNIRLLTADVFIPFRERLYFIRRNIAIRNDNIIFL